MPTSRGLEACAAAFTRLRPRRVFAPGLSRDGAEPHLLKQRPKGEPSRRKIGARPASLKVVRGCGPGAGQRPLRAWHPTPVQVEPGQGIRAPRKAAGEAPETFPFGSR